MSTAASQVKAVTAVALDGAADFRACEPAYFFLGTLRPAYHPPSSTTPAPADSPPLPPRRAPSLRTPAVDANCAPRPNPATFAPRAGSVLEQVWAEQGRKAPTEEESGGAAAEEKSS